MVLSIEAVLSRCCGHPHWFLQTASDGIAYSCVSHHSIEFVGIVIAHKAHHFSLVKVEKTFSCHDHRRSAKHRPYGSLVMRCLFLQNHRVGSKGYDSVIMFSKRSPAKSTTLFHQNMTALELEINKRSLTKCISCGQSFLRHLFCQYKAGFFWSYNFFVRSTWCYIIHRRYFSSNFARWVSQAVSWRRSRRERGGSQLYIMYIAESRYASLFGNHTVSSCDSWGALTTENFFLIISHLDTLPICSVVPLCVAFAKTVFLADSTWLSIPSREFFLN